MASSEEELRFRATGVDAGASRLFDKLADAVDDAGDEVKGLDRQLGKLDEQIDLTKLHLAVLIDEFDRTGDKTLFRDIRRDRSTLSMLQKMRAEVRGLGEDSDDAGSSIRRGVLGSLRDSLSSLPSELKGAAIVGAVGAAAAMAPLIGAAIGGAVLGGVGAGGVIGGIALAARDSRVQAAGSELGEHLLGGLQDAAEPFVRPLLLSLQQLEGAGDDLVATLGKGFAGLSRTIMPLTRGIEGMVHNLGPGLEDAFEAAEPLIRAIANELPELGDSISYALSAISDESDGAIMGLTELFHMIEFGIEVTGDLVAGLSAAFEWLVRTGDAGYEWGDKWLSWLPIAGPLLSALHGETSSLIDDLNRANSSGDTLVGSMAALTREAERQKKAINDLNDGYEKAFGVVISVEEAHIRLEEQWDATFKVLSEGTRTLDINSEAGQQNKTALIDLIQAAEAAREAEFAKTGSMEAANKVYDAQLERLRKTAERLGFNKQQVDALINSVKSGNLLGGLKVPVSMPGLDRYLHKLDYFINQLGIIGGFKAAEFSEYRAGERDGRASGGPVTGGRTYMVGENGPELVTMGEDGYVHNASQTRAMMSGASGGSAAPQRVEVIVSVDPSLSGRDRNLAEALIHMLRYETRAQFGGDVQMMFGQ